MSRYTKADREADAFLRLRSLAYAITRQVLGLDGIVHSLAVEEAVEPTDLDARIVALLHDVIEDSAVTGTALIQVGIPERLVRSIETISRAPGEPYSTYIARVARDPLAREVKVADLRENLRRCEEEEPKRPGLAKRYRKALGELGAEGRIGG